MGGPWEKYQGASGAAAPQPGTMAYYDNFARAPSNSLPVPGDPTSFSGGTPAGQVTPGRYGPDTMRALGIDIAVNGGKGASTIINNDPGQQYARTYANKVAEDNANVADLQNAVTPLLRRVEDFRNIARNAGQDVLTKATGPDYSGGYSYLPLPDASSQMYQNARQLLQHLNPFSDQESYKKATNANLEMAHLKDAISASFKQLPGSGKGGATDQAQRTVDNMLGHAMNAQDPETFFKIAHDAMNTIRGFARLPDEDASNAIPKFNDPSAPQVTPQAAAPRPRAVNPQTGHAVEWDGTKWVDAQ